MRYTKKNDFRRNWKFHMENVIVFLLVLFAAPVWCVADIELDKHGNSVEFAYATMSDGVKIAVAVGYPKGFDPQDQAQKWPAILEMSGYPNASQPVYRGDRYGERYVTVSASIRGTGAWGGLFAAFSERTIKDGYEGEIGVADDKIDGVDYQLAFDKPTAICGPITVTLWASSTTLDTDFFVLLSDVGPDGGVQYLQRGLLRASHRALDEGASLWANVQGEKVLIRPHHPHVDPEPLYPRKPYRFDIEVFPVGHVFRSGHKLSLSISQPPLDDPVPVANKKWGTYKYESNEPPGTVTIYRGADYPSSILLPVLPDLPPISGNPPDVGTQQGISLQINESDRKAR